MAKQKKTSPNTIAQNKKARHDYHIDTRYEAGLVLEGWEVKSLRAGRAQINEAYVQIKNSACWLIGALITPLPTASTHINPDPTRTRKLLLNHKEIKKLIGAKEQKGFTIVPLTLYWKKSRAKLEIALAKGKQNHDKRETIKQRDWQRDKARILKGR